MCASLRVTNPRGRNESECRSDPSGLAAWRRTTGASQRAQPLRFGAEAGLGGAAGAHTLGPERW
jgi:hypothetical protein